MNKQIAASIALPGSLASFCAKVGQFSRTCHMEIPAKIQALETLSVQIKTCLAFMRSADMRDAYVDGIARAIAPIGRLFGMEIEAKNIDGCKTAFHELSGKLSLGILCCQLAQAIAASTENPGDLDVIKQAHTLWGKLGEKADHTGLLLLEVIAIWTNFNLAPVLVVSEDMPLSRFCQTQQEPLTAQYCQILNEQLEIALSAILGAGFHGEIWSSQEVVLASLTKQLPVNAMAISDKNRKYLQILTTVLYSNNAHLLPDPVMQLQGVLAWGLGLQMTPLLPASVVSRGKSGTVLDVDVERLPLCIKERFEKLLKIVRDQIQSKNVSSDVKARWKEAERRIGDCVADLVKQTLTAAQEKSVVSILQQWNKEMGKVCSVGVDIRLIQLREDIAKACGQRVRQTWAPWAIERMSEILRGVGINPSDVHVVNRALLQVMSDTAMRDPYGVDAATKNKILRQKETLSKLFFFTPVLIGAEGFELDRVCADRFVKRGKVRGMDRMLATETAMRELSLETVQTLGLEKTSDILRCAAKSGRRDIFDWIATGIPGWDSRLFEGQPDGLSLMDAILYGGITDVLCHVDQATLRSGMQVYLPTTQNRPALPNALGIAAESGKEIAVDFVVSHIPAEQLTAFATAHERKGGDTPLMRAVMGKNPEVVRRVLALPGVVAGIDQRNTDGQTALIFAVESELITSVRILVEKGADVLHCVPSSGSSAIDLALIKQNREILSLVVPAVITKLCDETEAVRRAAVIAVAHLSVDQENHEAMRRVPELFTNLARLLGDSDGEVRRVAVYVIAHLAVDPANDEAMRTVPKLFSNLARLLGDSDGELRRVAVIAIAHLSVDQENHEAMRTVPELFTNLARLLGDSNGEVRREAVIAIAHLSVDQANHEAMRTVPKLFTNLARLLGDSDDEVCSEAVYVVSNLSVDQANHEAMRRVPELLPTWRDCLEIAPRMCVGTV